MGKITPSKVQEIIFASSEKKESRRITGLLKGKLVRKIAPRIYTSNLEEDPALIIRRNWYRILANQFPEALLSHRSALEFKPTPEGHIFLTYSYTSNVSIPGLTIHLLKGPKPIDGDAPFFENLFANIDAGLPGTEVDQDLRGHHVFAAIDVLPVVFSVVLLGFNKEQTAE